MGLRLLVISKIEVELANLGWDGDEARKEALACVNEYEDEKGLLISAFPVGTSVNVVMAMVMCTTGVFKAEESRWLP